MADAKRDIVYSIRTEVNAKNIDDLTKSIDDAGKSTDGLNNDLVETSKSVEKVGESSGKSKGKVGGFFSAMGKGIKGIGKAFIATGIGAIIALIVGGLALLKKAFGQTAQGQDAMAEGMGRLEGYMDIVMKGFRKLATVIINAFKKPKEAWNNFKDALQTGYDFIKKQIINRIGGKFEIMAGKLALTFAKIKLAWDKLWGDTEGIAEAEKAIEDANNQILEGTKKIEKAQEDLGVVIDGVTQKIKEQNDAATVLGKKHAEINKLENAFKRWNRQMLTVNAKLEQILAKNEAIADDATKSFDVRMAAAKKADEAQSKLHENAVIRAKKEYNLALAKAKIDGLIDENEKTRLAELKVKKINALGEQESAQKKSSKRISEIKSDQFEIDLDAEVDYTDKKLQLLYKQASDENISIEVRKKANKEAEQLAKESYTRQIKMFSDMTGKKIDINEISKLDDADKVKEYLKGLGLSEVLTTRFLQDVLKEQLQVNADIKDSNRSVTESSFIFKSKVLEKEKKLNLEKLNNSTATEEEKKKKAIEIQTQYLNDLVNLYTTEMMADGVKTDEEIKNLNKLKAARDAYVKPDAKQPSSSGSTSPIPSPDDMQKRLDEAISISNQFIDYNNAVMDAELAKTQAKYDAEDAMAKKSYNKKLKEYKKALKNGYISETQYDKKVNKLKETYDAESTARRNARDAEEEESRKKAYERNKKFAIANLIMNASKALIGTWAGYAEMGPIGTALATIQTALIVGTSVAQISKVNSTQYAEQGGYLTGPSHLNGGIKLEAQGGEMIMKKEAVQKYAPVLNSINDEARGNGTAQIGSSIDYDRLAAAMQSKKVYVVSHDITDQQDEDVKIKDRTEY